MLNPGDYVWYYNGNISATQNVPRSVWFPGSNPGDQNDYLGHGKEIFYFIMQPDGLFRRGQPHLRAGLGSFAWLNNNPGNITGVPGGPDWGQYPDKFSWHNFLIFPWEASGFDAIARFLREGSYPAKTHGALQWPAGNYRDLGITAAFHRYAPVDDGNNPEAYGASVAAAAGVSSNTLVGDLDDEQMLKMQLKIQEIEGWVPGSVIDPEDPSVPAAIRGAFF